MLLCTWVCKYLFKSLSSLLLGIHTEVELLDHMAILSFYYVSQLTQSHCVMILHAYDVWEFYLKLS